jgi:hypothetical protein
MIKNTAQDLPLLGSMVQVLNANGAISPGSLGYQYTIQTTTQIRERVIYQKFYEIFFEDYIPTDVGLGAWMEDIKTNAVVQLAGEFEHGITSLSTGPSNIPTVSTGIFPITADILTWNAQYNYTIPEVNKALAANNWDVVEAKIKALENWWRLGLQRIAFLGSRQLPSSVPGLLTNPNVTVDTTTLPQFLSLSDPTQFASFVSQIIGAYFENSNQTALPDTFLMPTKDFFGLLTPISPNYPNGGGMMRYLWEAFVGATGNQNFRIAPIAYCDASNADNVAALGGVNRYCLYRYNPDTVKMDIPVDFMLTPAATADNYNWTGVAVGQFTGAIVYRPAEVYYLDN